QLDLLEKGKSGLITASGFHLEATITKPKDFTGTDLDKDPKVRVAGDIVGDNFELTIYGKGPDFPVLTRCVRDKYWISHDKGRTWAPTRSDRTMYNLLKSAYTSVAMPGKPVV